jgi:hypothetical protein
MARITTQRSRWAHVRWGVLLLAACDWNLMGPSSCVGSVQLSPTTATVQVGQTVQLTATTYDTNGHIIDGRPVTWMSERPAVADVNAGGLVTGVAVGQTGITATSDQQSAKAEITVTAAPLPPLPPPPPRSPRRPL